MIAFITICYCGLIWLIFYKLKLLPFNLGAKITVTVIGLAGIITLLVFMTMYQPYSKQLMVFEDIVQIAPQVSGRVVDVPVKALVAVEKGDVLFKIDSKPYEYEVARLESLMEEAKTDLQLARTELKRAETVLRQGAGSPRNVNQWKLRVAGKEGTLGKYQAELDKAEYDLAETTVYAPADGFAADLQLLAGASVSVRQPVMAFVEEGDHYAIAFVSQDAVRHIRAGNRAEVALELYPGRIFDAVVSEVVRAGAQRTPTGILGGQAEGGVPEGTLAVRLNFEAGAAARNAPSGSAGTVAIYTDKGKPIRIIRKVIIRMYTWLNFLPG